MKSSNVVKLTLLLFDVLLSPKFQAGGKGGREMLDGTDAWKL